MGTRSYIGKDIGNGKYSVIFCQLESYLETTGRLLTEHYNTCLLYTSDAADE